MVELSPVASNRPDLNKTVAGAINEMLRKYREGASGDKRISIATAYINPAGYALLADELNSSSRVRLLIGAEPEFDTDRAISNEDVSSQQLLDNALASHEAWLAAERDLSGFSAEAVASAQGMVDWLETHVNGAPLVEVRRFSHGFLHGKSFMIEAELSSSAIAGSSNFTKAGLSTNVELNLATSGSPGHVKDIVDWFEHYWNQSEPYDLAAIYKAQWEAHQPWPVFIRMLEELYGDDVLIEETPAGRLGLTPFQRDGVTRMKRLIAENSGVLVADEVGLGKSYLAAEVILTATEENRQRAVVIAPAAIKSSMWDPFLDNNGFKRNVRVYSFEEVRNRMMKPEEPTDAGDRLAQSKYKSDLQVWLKFQDEIEDYALVVVDEAHNLRNSNADRSAAVDKLILSGKHPKQVILLTATPVNNSLSDLETLLKYFIRDDARFASSGIPSIREYIKRAQDMDPDNLSPEHLFDLMDQIAVRRTRKFVRENYSNDKIVGPDGVERTIKFPTPKSHRIDYDLDPKGQRLVDEMLYALSYDDEVESNNSYSARKADPRHLMLARYTPSKYLIHGHLERNQVNNAGLLRSALLKRLESSPFALKRTLEKLIDAHAAFLKGLEAGWVIIGSALSELTNSEDDGFLEVLESFDIANRSDIESVELYRKNELLEDVESDRVLLLALRENAEAACEGADLKYNRLVDTLTAIADSAARPDQGLASSNDRRKVILFSTFADTIDDLHRRLSLELEYTSSSSLAPYRGRLAPPIYGSYSSVHQAGKSGGVDQGGRAAVIAGFAPRTAGTYKDGHAIELDQFDILLTTDVLAEGVNLQQAGQIINYDLPWNPMRIVQRHGRVDRIGSEHDYVNLSLFFPNQALDSMLGLEARLQQKLAQAHAAVGEHIEVLANGRTQADVILHDKTMTEFDAFLEERGGSGSISGEEFRRKLYKHLLDNPAARASTALPFGSGSGFVNPLAKTNAYVFCLRVGNHDKPWFRYVQVDDNWSPSLDSQGKPAIRKDSLTALTLANPGTPSTARVLSDDAYSGVFEAWELAQADVFAEWTFMADPMNRAPKTPRSFKLASRLVEESGDYLDVAEQTELVHRLSAVPAKKVELAVGRLLRDVALNPGQQIERLKNILDDAGIQAPARVEPISPVKKHEIRLVTWMAVKAGSSH